MNIEVTIDDLDVVNMLNKLDSGLSKAIDFAELAVKGVQIIKQKTAAGVDVDGNSFAEYSDNYKRFKGKTHDASTVNMMYSNDMLASMQGDRVGDTGVIFFADSTNATKAKTHNEGLGNMPKRKFFGLNDGEDTAQINALAKSQVDRYLSTL